MIWVYIISTGILTLVIAHFFLKSFKEKLLAAGISGKDINKASDTPIPESGGTPILLSYIIGTIGMSIFITNTKISIYGPLLSISIAILLGFMDDVLGLRWRYKLFIPLVASVPLVASFSGATSVSLPVIGTIELGVIYLLVVIPAINIYTGNAINMLAGINLLEVGQSIIIASTLMIIAVLRNDMIMLYLGIPFIFASLVLARENKYPAKVFVGNSYTYGAGQILSAIAILGNMEKVLL
ncbi:MAG: hypothetical protein QXL15_01180, partial [Candidatus Korarchaeota archaeon]